MCKGVKNTKTVSVQQISVQHICTTTSRPPPKQTQDTKPNRETEHNNDIAESLLVIWNHHGCWVTVRTIQLLYFVWFSSCDHCNVLVYFCHCLFHCRGRREELEEWCMYVRMWREGKCGRVEVGWWMDDACGRHQEWQHWWWCNEELLLTFSVIVFPLKLGRLKSRVKYIQILKHNINPCFIELY